MLRDDANDRIIYNSVTGELFFDGDGNGAGAAAQFAYVTPGAALIASDIIVIGSRPASSSLAGSRSSFTRAIVDPTNGEPYIDADGSGVGALVQFATMAPGLSLNTSDFAAI